MSNLKPVLEFERAVTATIVHDVQLSPDGRWVAYVTAPISKEGEHDVGTIWLVGADGGPSRRLTGGEVNDRAPRWSPDGRWIALLSDRKERGKAQLYLLPRAGGEALRLTDQPGGVLSAAWSPDGRKLAFTAMPGESDAEKQRKAERNDHKIIDAEAKRAGLFVLTLPAVAAALAPDDLPEAQRLSPEDLHVGGYVDAGFAWAPDSTALVTVGAPSPKGNDLQVVEMRVFTLDGEITSLGRFEGITGSPRFSPDGSTIAFIGAEDVIPARWVLQTVSSTGGERTVVAPGYKGSFISFAWLPEGDRILAGVETGQRHDFQIVDLEAGKLSAAVATPERPGSGADRLSVSADGRRIAFAWSDALSFGEVCVADIGEPPRVLTDLNPWTREYAWGEQHDITWRSFDGREIEGILILPVGYRAGQRYPLLLDIHGGPAAAWTHTLYADCHSWGQALAQRGFAVLLPNPRGSTGQGVESLQSIINAYGEPDWRDLMAGVDHLIAQGIADPDKLVVGGGSGGGYLTNVTITRTDRFKAAVCACGPVNWVSSQGLTDIRFVFDRYLGEVYRDPTHHWRLSPIAHIANARTPTLIVHGEEDRRVPVSQGYELYEALKAVGVETQLVVYPREGHGFSERKHQIDVFQRVIDWFERHV